MKKKIILLAMTCLAIMATSFGQVDESSERDANPEQCIFAIRDVWADRPIRVENIDPNARIWSFAKAFCSMYQEYRPNEAMTDYLKKPGNYSFEDKHYLTEDDPRHGYIKCDMAWQFDYMTEMCYWRRPNRHQLVGILMQVGHEGEKCDAVLLFYDFDPKTQLMSPDLAIYESVMAIVGKHTGDVFFSLPKEGKDIDVMTVYWSEIDDFVYDGFLLKWTGNSFVEAELELELEEQ